MGGFARESVTTFARRCAGAEPLAVGLGPERRALVETLIRHTGPEGRVLWEDRPAEREASRWTALLPVLTGRSFIGGLDPDAGIEHIQAGLVNQALDGRPVSSCLVLAASVRGRSVTTLRGLERNGGLHPLQEAFVRHGAVQCGFCTPGMLLTALAFLEREPRPDREAIRAALEGNLCRCTGYTKIVDAVEAYARERGRG